MTLYELEKNVLALIEELNPNNANLTDDPDIAAKRRSVINQRMYELARFKKIPRYVEMDVTAGDLIEFADIEKICGNEVYQLNSIKGVNVELKANGTIFKALDSGIAEVEVFVYPERITDDTKPKAYEFELSPDVLEIMPYGVAADLLLSDVSANYGQIYIQEFERRLNRLDSRYNMPIYTVEGGVNI